jgi:hypothetical protein
VENKQDLKVAFSKELSEEVTEDFLKTCDPNPSLVAVDRIEFPPSKQGLRDMFTDSGESVVMKGKFYYFLVSNTKETEITLGATEFDDIKWLNFDEAYKLIKETNTGGRLRMMTNILGVLKDKGLLSTNQPTNHGSEPTTRPENSRPHAPAGRLPHEDRRDNNPRREPNTGTPRGSQLHSTSGVGRRPDSISGGNTSGRQPDANVGNQSNPVGAVTFVDSTPGSDPNSKPGASTDVVGPISGEDRSSNPVGAVTFVDSTPGSDPNSSNPKPRNSVTLMDRTPGTDSGPTGASTPPSLNS